MLGSGAIIVVDDSTPILDVAMKVARFYRHESCGKCTPCREGTNWTVKMLERIETGEATPMDLDIMASVAGAHHRQLPVRARRRDGDADRLDIAKFRDELEAHISRPLACAAARANTSSRASRWRRRGRCMPRPQQRTITLTIDGREVQAPGERDARRCRQARRRRDPRVLLRAQARPAGRRLPHVPGARSRASRSCRRAARQRSRTGWSCTPNRSASRPRSAASSSSCSSTTRSTARSATRAASARCRTSRFGWGPGDLALHRAQAPLRQAARALADDRDRPRALHPLLPLRALLPGGRRRRPARAGRARRRDVRLDVRRASLHAPFAGNIIELCPVGALTSRPYRFAARPWDIEDAGSVCTLCPAQCNVSLTVRDERVLRVQRARQRPGRRRLAVRSRPLRLPRARRRRPHPAAAAARRRRAAAGLLGASAAGGGSRAEACRRAHRRDRRRAGDQRGGLLARAPAARGARRVRTSTRARRAS